MHVKYSSAQNFAIFASFVCLIYKGVYFTSSFVKGHENLAVAKLTKLIYPEIIWQITCIR